MFIKENNNKSRSLKEAEGDIVTFNELNNTQQEYVIKNAYRWNSLDWIWEFYNEGVMDWYHDQKDEIAQKYMNEYGFDINTDKIYWQSSSQGPYPEWRLQDIFDTYYYTLNGENPEATIEFDGRSTDPSRQYSIDLYYYDTEEYDDWVTDYGLSIEDLSNPVYNLTPEFIQGVKRTIDGAQKFIDEIWSLISDVCTSYPDDEYIRTELEDSDTDFEIIDDTKAEPYYDTMRW